MVGRRPYDKLSPAVVVPENLVWSRVIVGNRDRSAKRKKSFADKEHSNASNAGLS
jgi:hypothetical protein